MKLPINVLRIAAICMYCTQIAGQDKQSVTAYKTVDRTKEWTIGIYDANNHLVSDQVVFKTNTTFLSSKGKKLAFDWSQSPNYIYIATKNVGDKNIANEYLPNRADILRSEGITPAKAPVGSKIKIDAEYRIIIEKPKAVTRTITISTDGNRNGGYWTVQASKVDNIFGIGDDLYGKPLKISIPGKKYRLTIPRKDSFYIINQNSAGLGTKPIITLISIPPTNDASIKIDKDGNATIVSKGSSAELTTINRPSSSTQQAAPYSGETREQELHGGF